jgi:hypothetical protein
VPHSSWNRKGPLLRNNIKGIVSKFTDVPKIWQNERLQQKMTKKKKRKEKTTNTVE